MSKQLSVYEKQQLLKYGLSESDFLKKKEMPIEYFTGWVDFAGLTLKVNKDVLIPRIETEELVDHALEFLKNNCQQKLRILDLATGSGAIGLALMKQLDSLNFLDKNLDFYLTDQSARALALAKSNYQKLLSKLVNKDNLQVSFLLSNLFAAIKDNLQFDLVLANLPYIPSLEIKNLSTSVKDFEPILALDGGKTGFELIARALDQILKKNILAKDAVLIFETYHTHNYQFVKNNYSSLFEKFKIKFIKDQFNRQRFLWLKKSGV